ncbi:tyrosine-type recombinase/integrase [Magnetovibrio sp.]|uniref:tyrosine-type recombinase/integrase n=1 Tax=Magnetovibrio sp. TaxID=2024836 RepID=UPI002F953B40
MAAKWQQESFLEQHFAVIPEVPFVEAALRYGQERQRDNPVGYKARDKYILQRLLDRFGDLSLSGVTHAVMRKWVDELLERMKPATALRELTVLKAILNKAFREEYLAQVPPFPRIKVEPGRCRWLTVEEEQRLLMAGKPHLRALIGFAVDTGGRKSELLKLDWQNVDLDRGFVTFRKTKNGEDRTVRLTDRAKRILQGLKPKASGPVFTYRGQAIKDVKTAFGRACKRAEVEDFRFHDLRHTFASRLVQQGVSLYEVMHLTGHKSFEMVQRYAHLAPDFQERAIGALNAYGTVSAQSA